MTIRRVIFKLRDFIQPRLRGEEAQSLIYEKIQSGEPFMMARFGAVEIKGMLYGSLVWPFNLAFKGYSFKHMGQNAGFFPVDKPNLKRFAKLMMRDAKDVDVLASWRPEEQFLRWQLRKSEKVSLRQSTSPCEEPYAWSRALEGKKVLVIHPFSATIEQQYNQKREQLFEGCPWILPEFHSLQTIKAVQSIAGNKPEGFNDWFEALEWMEKEIDKLDFDIALIGCGAYGLPLAAHIKRRGKQALHLGGSLQLFFGIKGKRWDNYPFYNEYWVSPSDAEKPKGVERVEGGCYW